MNTLQRGCQTADWSSGAAVAGYQHATRPCHQHRWVRINADVIKTKTRYTRKIGNSNSEDAEIFQFGERLLFAEEDERVQC